MFQLRRRRPSDRGQPTGQALELSEVECDSEIDVAREAPKISHVQEERGGADHHQVGAQLMADLVDACQVGDLVGSEDFVHGRNSRRNSSAASRARGSLLVNNSAYTSQGGATILP